MAGASAHDWVALVGSSLEPAGASTGEVFRGPQDPPVVCPVSSEPDLFRCDDTAYGKGAGGQLRYALDLPAGSSRTVWFTVAGSDHGMAEAQAEFAAATRDPAAALARKVGGRLALARHTRVDLPGDPLLAQAVEWGNRTSPTSPRRRVTSRSVPPGRGPSTRRRSGGWTGSVSRAPASPTIPWLFATDGEYTAFAQVAAGQFGIVKDHLRALREVSEIANAGSGKVVHEVVTDGSIFFGLNDDPGNTDETVKFSDVVALVWRWTGDDRFRDEMYPFVKKTLQYVFANLDADGDL